MAVYTRIDDDTLKELLGQYELGALQSFEGITEGVENTNYRVTTDGGVYVLTLFEKRTSENELPFFTGLMQHMRKKGIPCPAVAETRDGRTVTQAAGKPALITAFLQGGWPRQPGVPHCAEIGGLLGNMHRAVKDFPMKRSNHMSLPAWKNLVHACRDGADTIEQGLFAFLETEVADLEQNWPKYLPRGAVHADLFPDNVFFDGNTVSGVIDFYFACSETFAYDLMLTMNAWCFDRHGQLDRGRAEALLNNYNKARPLTRSEIRALPFFGRAAALRIVATRLYDWLNPAEGALVRPKDPMEHVRILRWHREYALRAGDLYGFGASGPGIPA